MFTSDNSVVHKSLTQFEIGIYRSLQIKDGIRSKQQIKNPSLLLHRALWIHLIYYTPTNELLYCNSLKSLH